ncbi:MAG TPA: hypothetical protein DF383_08065 [Deltaproteobacteria bacterium]|nr:hypothetical protein [Deltaproteobacteria bacterium]
MVLVKKLSKIGNSYGVILPAEVLEIAGLSKEEEVEISVKENRVILKPTRLKDHQVMKVFMGVLEDYDKTFEKLAK